MTVSFHIVYVNKNKRVINKKINVNLECLISLLKYWFKPHKFELRSKYCYDRHRCRSNKIHNNSKMRRSRLMFMKIADLRNKLWLEPHLHSSQSLIEWGMPPTQLYTMCWKYKKTTSRLAAWWLMANRLS